MIAVVPPGGSGRDAVMAALAAVPELLSELDVTQSRADAIAVRGDRAPSGYGTPERLPYHSGAATASRRIVSVLRAAGARVARLSGIRPPTAPDRLAQYLFRLLPAIADDSTALAGLDPDLTAAVSAAYAVIDRPERRVCIGRCRCGAALYAVHGAEYISCNACATIVSVAGQRNQALSRVYDTLGTATEIARLLPDFTTGPATAERIRQWAKRGKLVGMSDGTRTVYRLGDVVELCSGAAHHRRSA